MAGRNTPKREQQSPPAYYVATEPLFIGGQFGRAFNVGDRVPVEHVDRYGWADKVRRSDEAPSEQDQPPAAPQNEPETDQATSKEGEA
ncbi:hypothetical protein [Nonomuraea sp. NPDC050310]|uniref:hypothetical protein n=1 Tax=Nonomuraea sp. NPDC050310 TaxID=3154935 RepID=UPI0033D55151